MAQKGLPDLNNLLAQHGFKTPGVPNNSVEKPTVHVLRLISRKDKTVCSRNCDLWPFI